MADYTVITDFASKDALATGNPAKAINGTMFGAEYDAIAAAIATKANSAGPTLTGTTTVDALAANTVVASNLITATRYKESDPSFVYAYASANQTSGAVGAKITFDTEVSDLSADFASSVFTAEHDGLYLFSAVVYYYNGTAGALDTYAYLYHSADGDIGRTTRLSLPSGLASTCTLHVLYKMTAGQTVEIRNGGNALSATYYIAGGGARLTTFMAKLLTRT